MINEVETSRTDKTKIIDDNTKESFVMCFKKTFCIACTLFTVYIIVMFIEFCSYQLFISFIPNSSITLKDYYHVKRYLDYSVLSLILVVLIFGASSLLEILSQLVYLYIMLQVFIFIILITFKLSLYYS